MHRAGDQVINNRKCRYCDNHADETKESAKEENRKQYPETRKSCRIAQDLRSQNIAVKLLQKQNPDEEIHTLERTDQEYQERCRYRTDERSKKRYHIRHTDNDAQKHRERHI